MKDIRERAIAGLLVGICGLAPMLYASTSAETSEPELNSGATFAIPPDQIEASPATMAATSNGQVLYVGFATANRVAVFEPASARITHYIATPDPPLGLALSRDGSRLYIACAAPASTICVLEVAQRQIIARIPVGHTAMAPVLSPDEQRLFVCNRFNQDISVIDLSKLREMKRITVEREPTAAAMTPDGRYLLVANHLHASGANQLHIAAAVSIIDAQTLQVLKTIRLTLGAGLLNGVAVSPDGRFAAVTHILSRYWLPTSAVELGRMNGSALSILDLERFTVLGTVLLDRTSRGAANPWGVVWTADGKTIAVAHAGTHELSLIDAPVLADPASFFRMRIGDYAPTEKGMAPLPRQRPVRVRKYLPLPGKGPRALVLAGSNLYVANYFSDNLCRIDLAALEPKAESLPLGPLRNPSVVRRGEMLFNDAELCFQGWQSCASCHDSDGRTDALNWDLLNDGVANPKNTRSLLWAHQTGPAMALGVRTNAAAAVRAGLHHILFSQPPEAVAESLDAYLKSLHPVESPHLVRGRLTEAAERGKQLFFSERTACAQCHPAPYFTDMTPHDVGTASTYRSLYGLSGQDKPVDRFYSPALAELWRTAPYLHDGSAQSLQEVLTTYNREDRHGRTSQLTAQQLDDLVAYLLSL